MSGEGPGLPGAHVVGRIFDEVAEAHAQFMSSCGFDSGTVVTAREVQAILEEHPGGGVLDIGCGTGHFGFLAAERGHQVTLVDISERMLEVAARRLVSQDLVGRARILRADAHDLRMLGDGGFGTILLLGEVLNYASDPRVILDHLWRICRPGGRLLASVVSRVGLVTRLVLGQDFPALDRFLESGLWEERGGGDGRAVLALRPFEPAELEELLTGAGFRVRRIFPRSILGTLLPADALETLGEGTFLAWEERLAAFSELRGCALGFGVLAEKPNG